MSFVIRASMHQMLGDRENQEDSIGISRPEDFPSKGLLAVLSDGMGGMERGEVYSSMAVNAMLEAFHGAPADADLTQGLRRMYQQVRAEAARLWTGAERVEDGGATLAAAIVRGEWLAFLSVGDSSIDLFRGGGLVRLNRHQTVGVRLDERAALGYIPEEVAQMNLHRSALTNHINTVRDVPCDVCSHPVQLLPGDRILITSDGITDTLAPQILTGILTWQDEYAAQAIIAETERLALPRQDNASAIVLDVLLPTS